MLLFGLYLMSFPAQAAAPFGTPGFNYIANIRINGNFGTEVLSNFPVLLKFNTNTGSPSVPASPEQLRSIRGGTIEVQKP